MVLTQLHTDRFFSMNWSDSLIDSFFFFVMNWNNSLILIGFFWEVGQDMFSSGFYELVYVI